jgi:hypothetical protein
MWNRLARWAPLTGIVSGLLVFAAFASGSSAPSAHAPGDEVATFVRAHGSGQKTSDILWTLGFVFLVFFAGSLRGYLRRSAAATSASTVMVVGAGMLTTGAAVYFGCDYVLATTRAGEAPATFQTLNALAVSLYLPVVAGGLVFGIASGVAILLSGQLPRWLGAAAAVIGALSVAGILALPLLGIWTIVAGVLTWKRANKAAQPTSRPIPKPSR